MICVSHPVTFSSRVQLWVRPCVHTKPIKWGVIYLGHATQTILESTEHPYLAPTCLPFPPLPSCLPVEGLPKSESREMRCRKDIAQWETCCPFLQLPERLFYGNFNYSSVAISISVSSNWVLGKNGISIHPPSAHLSTLLIRKVRFTIRPITDCNKLICCNGGLCRRGVTTELVNSLAQIKIGFHKTIKFGGWSSSNKFCGGTTLSAEGQHVCVLWLAWASLD